MLGIGGHVISKLRSQKTLKNGNFGLRIYKFAYNSKTTSCAKLKFWHNVGAYEYFMKTEFGGARFCDKNFTSRKAAKSLRIWTLYLGNCWYWCKMVCGFWAHIWQPLFWLCSFTQLKYYVSCFSFMFFSYFFFLLSFFFSCDFLSKPLNALYSNFERLKISERTFARQKLEVPGWGDTLNQVL